MSERAASERAAGGGGAPPPSPPPPAPPPPPPRELPYVRRHDVDAKACGYCGVVLAGKWKRCGGCHDTYYCSRAHFEAHWPEHAAHCNAVREREEAERCAGGLVLGADTERERREARSEEDQPDGEAHGAARTR